MEAHITPTLLSVHVPKSSGVSLRTALSKSVGAERVLLDYVHDPVDPATHSVEIGAEATCEHVRSRCIRVVHGHFPIRKYDALTGSVRAVMLREPVDNLISIYYFWNHLIDSGHTDGHALFRSFAAERPDIIEFARFPAFRRLLSGTFFGDYPMERFDIIGDFAERKLYWNAISRVLGVKLDASLHDNRTPRSDLRRQTARDTRVVRALRDILRDDICFYERWTGKIAA